MKRILTSLFILIVISASSFAQKDIYNTNSRTVVVNHSDFMAKANVLTVKKDIKINDDLKYYWYNNNEIGFNRGGINGKPLHGAYSLRNSNGDLIQQGEFKYGLKSGKWKKWYATGEIKSIENWENGLLHGESKEFSETGELLIAKDYKKGKEIESKESFLKRIFKKKESALTDSTQNEVETIEAN